MLLIVLYGKMFVCLLLGISPIAIWMFGAWLYSKIPIQDFGCWLVSTLGILIIAGIWLSLVFACERWYRQIYTFFESLLTVRRGVSRALNSTIGENNRLKCLQCNRPVGETSISIGDGDFICSVDCQRQYMAERDFFFDNTIYSNTKMEAWWEGKTNEEVSRIKDRLDNQDLIHRRLSAIQEG